jgi:outer membrane cobalamin receptor
MTPLKTAIAALAVMSALMASPAARASVVDVPDEVVTGSVIYDRDEDKYLSPGMVTVIRPDERAGEQRDLPALLSETPGLRVIQIRGRYGYAFASVRGSTSSQVAVYVDGVLMNLQSESAVDLSRIPVDSVDRIEVYRGYIPAKFGAQAMGGVINIVTKSPEHTQTDVSLGVGSYGKFKGSVSHSAPAGDGKFWGSFGYETYHGNFKYWNDNGTPYNDADDYEAERRNNGFENIDALLKWENADWRARLSWARRDRELATSGPGSDKPWLNYAPGPVQDAKRWDASLARSHRAGDVNWSWELSYTGQEKAYDSRTERGAAPIGSAYAYRVKFDTSRFGATLGASASAGERHFVEMLAAYSSERLNVGGERFVEDELSGDSDFTSHSFSINLQDTIALDKTGSFLAIPSVRWHRLDDDDHFTWQLALTKEFSPNWMVKGTYGTYARAPNMYEKYGDGAFILPPLRDLRWETGEQFDLGVIWNGAVNVLSPATARVSLSGFRRDSSDLIEFQMFNQRVGRYENIAEAKVNGAELDASLDWEKWGLAMSATWTDGRNKTRGIPGAGGAYYDGKRLPNRPEWSGSARLSRKFNKASAFVEYQYIGANYADTRETVLFDRRNIWNIGVQYNMTPTARLTLGVNDVFNDADDWRMYSAGYNGPERVLWYPVEGRSYYMTLDRTL